MNDSTTPRVGFVGLGGQGRPMARSIVDAGLPTALWARRAASLEPFADTPATVAPNLAELGRASDVICICVRDDTAVLDVLDPARGLLAGARPGATVCVHSTISPATVTLAATWCAERDVDFVDAPVSNAIRPSPAGIIDNVTAAERATAALALVVMAGGPAEVVARCRPVFETFADPVVHVGPVGSGCRAKLVNNLLAYGTIALVLDTLDAGRALGLSHDALVELLAAGSGRSAAVDVVASYPADLSPAAVAAEMRHRFGALTRKDLQLLAREMATSGDPQPRVRNAIDRTLDLLASRPTER